MPHDRREIYAVDAGRLTRRRAVAAVFVAALGDEGTHSFEVIGPRFQHDETTHYAIGGFHIRRGRVVFLAVASVGALAILQDFQDGIAMRDLAAQTQDRDDAAAGS